MIAHRSHVLRSQREQSLRSTGRDHELNLETVGRVHVDDSAEVASAKIMLRQIASENYGVEYVEHGNSCGERGDEVGDVLARGHHPDGEYFCSASRRPSQNSTDPELLPERALLADGRVTGAANREKRVA